MSLASNFILYYEIKSLKSSRNLFFFALLCDSTSYLGFAYILLEKKKSILLSLNDAF